VAVALINKPQMSLKILLVIVVFVIKIRTG